MYQIGCRAAIACRDAHIRLLDRPHAQQLRRVAAQVVLSLVAVLLVGQCSAQTVTDADVYNFALNLEYLEVGSLTTSSGVGKPCTVAILPSNVSSDLSRATTRYCPWD